MASAETRKWPWWRNLYLGGKVFLGNRGERFCQYILHEGTKTLTGHLVLHLKDELCRTLLHRTELHKVGVIQSCRGQQRNNAVRRLRKGRNHSVKWVILIRGNQTHTHAHTEHFPRARQKKNGISQLERNPTSGHALVMRQLGEVSPQLRSPRLC